MKEAHDGADARADDGADIGSTLVRAYDRAMGCTQQGASQKALGAGCGLRRRC